MLHVLTAPSLRRLRLRRRVWLCCTRFCPGRRYQAKKPVTVQCSLGETLRLTRNWSRGLRSRVCTWSADRTGPRRPSRSKDPSWRRPFSRKPRCTDWSSNLWDGPAAWKTKFRIIILSSPTERRTIGREHDLWWLLFSGICIRCNVLDLSLNLSSRAHLLQARKPFIYNSPLLSTK